MVTAAFPLQPTSGEAFELLSATPAWRVRGSVSLERAPVPPAPQLPQGGGAGGLQISGGLDDEVWLVGPQGLLPRALPEVGFPARIGHGRRALACLEAGADDVLMRPAFDEHA